MRRVFRSRTEDDAWPGAEGRTDTLVQEGRVVEEEVAGPPPPPPRPPRPLIWPWLLLLLLLVAGGLIAVWFFTRDNGHSGAARVAIPNVIGERQGDAVRRLDRARLTSRVVAKPSSAPSGTVFAEEPGPGAHVPRGSVVTLSVSQTNIATVPNVEGEKAPAAKGDLRARGFVVETANVRSSEASGVVVGQSPSPGTSAAKGSTVLIRVSRGTVHVPDVVGQSRSAAVSALRDAGLVPSAFTVPSAQPKATVVAQHPRAGTSVAPGSSVRLNLSNGSGSGAPPPPPPPAPVGRTVPDVTDEVQSAAQRELNAEGFKALVVYVSSDLPTSVVVSQTPAAGSNARKGTRVRLEASLGEAAGTETAVPRVIGLTPNTATARLRSAGFRVQRLIQSTSIRSQAGRVVDEQPVGADVPAGSTVTIYVGRLAT